MLLFWCSFFFLLWCHILDVTLQSSSYSHTRVHRSLDLSTQGSNVVYDKLELDLISSTQTDSLNYYVFRVPKSYGKIIRFKAYQVNGDVSESLTYLENKEKKSGTLFTIQWNKKLVQGEKTKLKIIMLIYQDLKPLPESIHQGEDQFLFYEQFFGYPLNGPIEEYSLTVKLPETRKPEFFTTLDPYQFKGKTIEYGPYKSMDPSTSILKLHFYSPKMGLTVEHWDREIWIRNFGASLEFEDRIAIAHHGAKLKDPFSRLQQMLAVHQPTPQSIIDHVQLALPPSIHELYYRDDTGNVSTSVVRSFSDRTLLMLKPRYLLLGGWKYNWHHGFSMSSSPMLESLSSSSSSSSSSSLSSSFSLSLASLVSNAPSRFRLTVPNVHPFSNPDVIVQHHRFSIVLPESATLDSVHVNQAPMTSFNQSQSYYYFDTTGRVTVQLESKFVYCNKPDLITIEYSIPTFAYYQKPLALTLALMGMYFSQVLFKKVFFG